MVATRQAQKLESDGAWRDTVLLEDPAVVYRALAYDLINYYVDKGSNVMSVKRKINMNAPQTITVYLNNNVRAIYSIPR